MSIREKLNDHDVRHRTEFADYATTHSASDWHRAHLEHLYRHWVSANGDYFGNACIQPHIVLAEPKSPSALGDHAKVSGWGSKNQIRIRPSLITGKHKSLKPGDEYAEGRTRFVEDVLLHESVHQYCDEALHHDEESYKGHGPIFAGECNRIGAILGLSLVRPAKARGKNKDLPSCAQWPHNVRPAGYYLGALAGPPKPDDDHDDGDDDEDSATFPCPLDSIQAGRVIATHFDGVGLMDLADTITETTGIMFAGGMYCPIDTMSDPGDFVADLPDDPEWLIAVQESLQQRLSSLPAETAKKKGPRQRLSSLPAETSTPSRRDHPAEVINDAAPTEDSRASKSARNSSRKKSRKQGEGRTGGIRIQSVEHEKTERIGQGNLTAAASKIPTLQ
jgi:hypothetical protein